MAPPPPAPSPATLPACLAALLCLGLAACEGKPPTSRFQVDICGKPQAFEQVSDSWEALFAAQLPGERGLTLAFGIPRVPPQEGQAANGMTVQFNLAAEPGLLRPASLPGLVRDFHLQADAGPRLRGPASAAEGDIGTGTATVFADGAVALRGQAGGLQVSDARVLRQDGDGRAYAVASGRFSFQAVPDVATGATATPCTVSGSFQDASFRLLPRSGG